MLAVGLRKWVKARAVWGVWEIFLKRTQHLNRQAGQNLLLQESWKKRLELPLSARCLTGLPLICLWLLKDMPSTTKGFTKAGDQVSVSEGVLSSFPRPEPPRRPLYPCSSYEPLSSKLHFPGSAGVCSKRDHQVKQLCGSCFLCLFFSLLPFSLPLFLSPLLSL